MGTYLGNQKECENCGAAHKGKPFCWYVDGYHCFSCGITHRGDRSFIVNPSYTTVKPDLSAISGEVIKNFSDFSLVSREWLTQYYITEKHVSNNSLFEIRENDQNWLLYPNIDETGAVVFYQKRRMGERGFISSGEKRPLYKRIGSDTVVIVEDFISYCRVGEFFDCVCLYGTQLATADAECLVEQYSNIVVWLDNDHIKEVNSGQIAAKRICNSLKYTLNCYNRNYGFSPRHVEVKLKVTNCDPKFYSDSEINNIIRVTYDDTNAERSPS